MQTTCDRKALRGQQPCRVDNLGPRELPESLVELEEPSGRSRYTSGQRPDQGSITNRATLGVQIHVPGSGRWSDLSKVQARQLAIHSDDSESAATQIAGLRMDDSQCQTSKLQKDIDAIIDQSLEYLEKAIDDSADKHTQEMLSEHHATMDKSLEHLEKESGDSADKHTQGEAMHVEQARLQKRQEEQPDDHHASLHERRDDRRKLSGDSADKQGGERPTTID